MHRALLISDFRDIASTVVSFTLYLSFYFFLAYTVVKYAPVLIFYSNAKKKLALSVYSRTLARDIRALNK